jgi:hypothetical protein
MRESRLESASKSTINLEKLKKSFAQHVPSQQNYVYTMRVLVRSNTFAEWGASQQFERVLVGKSTAFVFCF